MDLLTKPNCVAFFPEFPIKCTLSFNAYSVFQSTLPLDRGNFLSWLVKVGASVVLFRLPLPCNWTLRMLQKTQLRQESADGFEAVPEVGISEYIRRLRMQWKSSTAFLQPRNQRTTKTKPKWRSSLPPSSSSPSWPLLPPSFFMEAMVVIEHMVCQVSSCLFSFL